MKKILIHNKVIKIYDSIDELPILNFQKFNKLMLIDSGIGCNVEDIDEHITKIAKFIKTDSKKALQELQNMRQCFYMVSNEISPKYMAFTALIYEINGKRLTDLSDESLTSTFHELNCISHSWIVEFILKFKKKVNFELEQYFPNDSQDSKQKEAYDKVKIRTLLQLESIITGKDTCEEIERIDDYLISLQKPKSFIGSSSVEIKYDKLFENSCIMIKQKLGLDVNSMTVFKYYNAMENIKKQAENDIKSAKYNGANRMGR